MQTIRIIEIPKMKAVFSGPLSSKGAFEKFVKWFSQYHAINILMIAGAGYCMNKYCLSYT